MVTTLASSIEQFKLAFYQQHAHLSEHDRQQLWFQSISPLPCQSTASDQVPRSMVYFQPETTDFSTSHYGSMDRVPSNPAALTMEHQLSVMGQDNVLTRSSSTMSNWQTGCDDQQSAYAIYSESASAMHPIDATSSMLNGSTVEWSPAEYINNVIDSSNPSSLPLSYPQTSQLQLTPSSQWSPQLDRSTSPSTPSTALMTPVTLASNMSRQGSHNSHFLDDSSSMQFPSSDASAMYAIPNGDGSISFPSVSKSINHGVDTLHFLDQFTGSSSDAFLSSVPVFTSSFSSSSSSSSVPSSSTANASALAFSQNEPDLAEDMTRSASSSSSESNASVSSSPSTGSRHVRREREINARAVRCPIAPKANANNAKIESAPSNAQMVRIQSEDGSHKNVGVISKAAYVRPQHPKIMCPHCSERPDGFRGTHELERHVARAHTAVRKGFICVDASPNQKFLANCKHCRNKKVYGAYYNAAAHLRRAHFHPRKRGGKKGKHDEKRGGIGGGDDPPMDYLKQHWIRGIEVDNKTTAAPSPDSVSDNSMEPADLTSFDAPSFDFNLSSQPTNSMSMPMNMDTNQYFDFDNANANANPNNMSMSEPEGSYNPMLYASNDPNNFQFDAHRLQ